MNEEPTSRAWPVDPAEALLNPSHRTRGPAYVPTYRPARTFGGVMACALVVVGAAIVFIPLMILAMLGVKLGGWSR